MGCGSPTSSYSTRYPRRRSSASLSSLAQRAPPTTGPMPAAVSSRFVPRTARRTERRQAQAATAGGRGRGPTSPRLVGLLAALRVAIDAALGGRQVAQVRVVELVERNGKVHVRTVG